MTRRELVLSKVNVKKGVGLEIGPLTSPILSQQEANIFYADHVSQKKLREKYKDAPLNIEDIVPVDYIVKNSLLGAVGKTRFDYVIACHVIEHVPDTVRWLQDVASILKPNGILALAIPDKRFTFDVARNVSKPSDIMGAYLDKYKKPSSSMIYDFAIECRDKISSSEIWADSKRDWSKKPRLYSQAECDDMCTDNLSGKYVDSHCHVFTPYSFVEILRSLIENQLLDFEVIDYKETNDQNIEFYVSLKKIKKGNASQKKQLASLPTFRKPETLTSVHAANNKLRNEIIALRSEIEAMRSSKSWRITKPLRHISKQAGSLKNK